ncbi:MAG: ParB/RepB/Spo0J family partition protein [Clostridiales bacterium]|nr:ParB/RepB/Spo0J family partition protein [Clostridiales bacterium]
MALFLSNKKKEKEINKVIEIHIGYIKPNPNQPRKYFNTGDLTQLAKSILQDGILQPITVRRIADENYQLISGERRLRAARIAGLKYIPSIVLNVTERTSALLALVENIQREDLSFFEEAEAISQMIDIYGMTQEDAAIKLGMAQSTVANKLRLLRLSSDEKHIITGLKLTERHARALIKINDYETRIDVLEKIAKGSLNVEKTESYIQSLLEDRKSGQAKKMPACFKDIRLFMKTINKAVDIIKLAGVDVQSKKVDSGDDIQILITVPKNTEKSEAKAI